MADLQYWATLASDDLPNELVKRTGNYYDFIFRFGVLDRWKRCYLAYYGMSESGTTTDRLNQAGTNGELYVLKLNHFRSLIQSLHVLITQQPPAINPKAQNTDSKSLNQTVLAKSIIDYYMSEMDLERCLNEAAEFSLISGEGFLTETWDANAGEQAGINPSSGRPFYDGDVKFKSYHPIDVIREVYTDSNERPKWYTIRSFVNKYDLAAKYPEFADDIISITKQPDFMSRYHYIGGDSLGNGDEIPFYTFIHEETDAVPNGRMMTYITNDLWLTDTELPYKHLPVYRMSPAKWHGSPFGYTVAYDLMGIQRAYDAMESMAITNAMNYGQQNICVERGSEVNLVALAQGLNAIETNPGSKPPTPLNLLQTPPELFSHMSSLVQTMETLSGINSTARGNPEESLKSGTALALVAAQAVQFNSGLQRSYNDLIQDACTGLIEILQMFALTPRLAAIAGRSNRSRVKEFKGEDLSSITRVTCESVNPLMKTAAGRMQVADNLLQIPNMITTPQEYITCLETGTIEPLVENQTSQRLYIRSENEELADGKMVQCLVTDMHLQHIEEHRSVLDSIDARQNPDVIKNTVAHIQAHINQLKTADPDLLRALGQQPIPPPQPPMQGPPSGGPIQPHTGGPIAGSHFPQKTGMPAQLSHVPPVGTQATEYLGQPKLPGNLPKDAPANLVASYDQLKGNLQS